MVNSGFVNTLEMEATRPAAPCPAARAASEPSPLVPKNRNPRVIPPLATLAFI